ncbi:hypothetical protein [Deinococcus cellulosilyticus]|uniref:Uncharacterized protein n=1 Tax=Deinococcus cellulosilyticus (strain DSM 18568 / NBRC 106333 / KACC 11606 / 5516J-15) TaxID=1223518 RepID=A0A511N9A2_DEIC1|nr:hypothetical protein [Deinococcus cellulosilyticus]GEM49068.1 hypothetical protein DC3_47030 [Deinococcus cellulosilyticus NBRC 106333 = KACC 11606]
MVLREGMLLFYQDHLVGKIEQIEDGLVKFRTEERLEEYWIDQDLIETVEQDAHLKLSLDDLNGQGLLRPGRRKGTDTTPND